MIQQGVNRNNYFGSAVFAGLICMFLFVLSGNSAEQTDNNIPNKFVAESHSNQAAVVEFQQFHFQKSRITFIDKPDFKRFDVEQKLVSVNHVLHQRIFLLQKVGVLIRPFVRQRFYNQFHSTETDDLPALS